MLIEKIVFNDETLAIIIRKNYKEPGIHFLTPNDYSQQLAYMQHPAGKKIQPHLHNPVNRKVTFTQEVLLIKKGRLRVDFYSKEQKYLESKILEADDVILLSSGGHGFEVLEELEMFEVKQGPYIEHEDKERFSGIPSDQAIVKKNEEK